MRFAFSERKSHQGCGAVSFEHLTLYTAGKSDTVRHHMIYGSVWVLPIMGYSVCGFGYGMGKLTCRLPILNPMGRLWSQLSQLHICIARLSQNEMPVQ